MYDVMVRLILPTDTLRDLAIALIAGKKMNDEIGENVAAKEIINTITRF
jgi:hypothetical protein